MASPSDTKIGCNDPLPVPYEPGKCLGFQVLENLRTPPIPDDAYIMIGRVHSITMSPVMNVTIVSRSGEIIRAVLKVYDRRFGEDLRSFYREHLPCTSKREEAFQSFAKSGKMRPFLDELAKSREDLTDPIDAARFLDDDDDDDDEGGVSGSGGEDKIARYEAALWQTAQEYFECETKAYRRLAELQGKLIPRIYGHVRLRPPPGETERAAAEATAASTEEMAPYLEVKGILLERISGYSLWDLHISPLAPQDPAAWRLIVQAAIDAAETINSHGVRMDDSSPHNVVVDQRTQTPFIIDFAQCGFKEELIAMWEGLDEGDKASFQDEFDPNWEWNAEAHWWQQLHTVGNPTAIGAVAAMRVKREKGIELSLQYPDFLKTSAAIRQGAHGSSRDG